MPVANGQISHGCGQRLVVRPGDDGEPDLPSGGHAELPSGGQLDYLV
ncbi:MAG TPA: hypothetical protein VJ347_19125 [Streptosporangiaceae bacterium]|nr:hypothetical protein [Streptosporangiaceae bacterium]